MIVYSEYMVEGKGFSSRKPIFGYLVKWICRYRRIPRNIDKYKYD